MSQSSLQVLLHAGELEYIVREIKKSKQQKFVAGCLFGLWRNSLKQPVIQFVTGPPAKGFKTIASMLSHADVQSCARTMKEDHCLLHLGFWFCGSPDDRRTVLAEEFFQTRDSKYSVLLFINLTGESNNEELTGEYYLKNEQNAVELFKEDVLDGHSSFRWYEPLTSKLKVKGAEPADIGQDILSFVRKLPSRVQVEEAVTNENQWYSTDDGSQHLQLLFQYFSAAGIQPGMSRDAITHNIQFELGGGYCLDFPAHFPEKMPVLRGADGRSSDLPRGPSDKDVCQFVVDTVVEYFRKQQSRGGRGRGGGGRYR